jgi:hypothetical protein
VAMQVGQPTIGGKDYEHNHIVVGLERGIAFQPVLCIGRIQYAWSYRARGGRASAFQPATEGAPWATGFLQNNPAERCARCASVEQKGAHPALGFT